MTTHTCVPRPGESACFVCGRDLYDSTREHRAVIRTYGDDQVEECQRCQTDWPCPAVKAINRQAKVGRERRRAERLAGRG